MHFFFRFKGTRGEKKQIFCTTDWFEPLDENNPAHVSIAEQSQQFRLGFWASPIFKGDFPEIVRDIIGNRSLAQGFESSRLPIFSMEEKTMLKGSADFFGLNMYTSDLAQPLDFPIGKY